MQSIDTIRAGFGRVIREGQGMLERESVRRTMALEHQAAQSKQGRALYRRWSTRLLKR